MTIISANISHFEDVYWLICELEGKILPKEVFFRMYAKNLDNPDIYYILAHDEEKVIGFGSLHIQNLIHHSGKVGEIQELVTAKEHRLKGAGLTLLNRLTEIAKEQSCVLLEVCCNRNREQSHVFYERCGMIKSHYKFTREIEILEAAEISKQMGI